MLSLSTPQDTEGRKALVEWVAERLGNDIKGADFEPCMPVALMNGDTVVGCVVFWNYHRDMCEMAAAIDHAHCGTRGMLRQLFAYPFVQLGVKRLGAQTAASNERSRSVLRRLGFTVDGRLRRGYDGVEDALTYSMLPDECRWIRP